MFLILIVPLWVIVSFELLLFLVLQNPLSSGPWIGDTPRRAALADVSQDVSQDLFATPHSALAKRLPFQLLHNSSLVHNALITRKEKETLIRLTIIA